MFSRSKMQARHKSLLFFRSLAICSCSLRLCKALEALGGIGSLWDGLKGFGRLRRLCEFCKAMGSFERLGEALGYFVRF